ncbi:SDR family oxidoreductase [Micromonospora sp. NPDC049559]|uniref:SDR family oxidoreductase n=1 Tax=Micromonospora sp. NPDC049559 TaxID=3155923 RepID=UPI00341F4EBC
MTLQDARVLIVGGTSGLGLAVAQAVAARGATPIVASRSNTSVDRALDSLPNVAEGTTVDLGNPESVERLVAQAGPIDHLVYTAGEPLQLTMLPDLTTEVAKSFWETRYFGALAVIRAVTIANALRETGSIVLTGGNAGRRPGPGWAAPASLCGAMEALARELALELAPIRVNVVVPGVTRSPLWAGMPADQAEAMYEGIAAGLPVRRVGEPADVALSYVYAMEQPMATGTAILVDGGAVLV